MSDIPKNSPVMQLRSDLRGVRARYDKLSRGDTASIRRCRSADEIAVDGTYWRIAGPFSQRQGRLLPHLPHVVLHFPLAPQIARETFSFGRFLGRQLGDSDGATLRFRRLLDSRDRDDLDHRLRGILRLVCADKTPVDWGVLGTDILWFFSENGTVRRRWAQEFYAPMTSRPNASPISNA